MNTPLTAHVAYWASIVKADVTKGRTLQRAASDVFMAVMMMGRGKAEAMRVAEGAVEWAGFSTSDVKW